MAAGFLFIAPVWGVIMAVKSLPIKKMINFVELIKDYLIL